MPRQLEPAVLPMLGILLLGEFSGYDAKLARGFKQLGHDVTFFNSGHATVEGEPGIPCPHYGHGINGKLLSKIRLKTNLKKCSGSDLFSVIAGEMVQK